MTQIKKEVALKCRVRQPLLFFMIINVIINVIINGGGRQETCRCKSDRSGGSLQGDLSALLLKFCL